jgi:hypothetical protein
VAGSVRQLRSPAPKAEFSAIELVTKTLAPSRWVNLRWRQYATKKDLFFTSESARLTPSKGKARCLYLAPDERTAYLELYGDKIHHAHGAGRVPIMEANDFSERVFIQVCLPSVTLVDLTAGAGLEAIGIDLGTLYASDPQFPRAFAQSVLDHPAKVDGFLYESRHTKGHCAVVWSYHRHELAKIPWGNERPLGASITSLDGDVASLFGTKVQIAS